MNQDIKIRQLFEIILETGQAQYRFTKEDADITKKCHLENLSDSYDPKELVPDSVAQKVAEAYTYILDKKLGEQYLEQSILGRKISGIIAHDKKAIESFSHPMYDLCQIVKKEGHEIDELKARTWKNLGNDDEKKKKFKQQIEDYLKRIKLYQNVKAFPEKLGFPGEWKNGK